MKKEAVEIGLGLVQAYPEDALAYALLGSAYYNTGRSEEATRQLRKCLDLRPEQADAYGILARVAYDKGELDECVRLCNEGLKRGPGNPDVLNQLGRALMDLGRTEEAIAVLQRATQLQETVTQSFYLLGQAFLQASKFAEAKDSFQKAIALLPDHTQAFFGLFRACLGLGQTDEAQRYREQFVKLEAVDRRSLSDRSAQEDALSGLPMVRETVARTFFGAGQIYQVHNEPAKAAELFCRAATLDAECPIYRATLESFYVQRKSVAEGAEVFEKLAREQPNSRWNYFFLGRLRTRLGQADAAAAAYKKVQELAPEWPEGYRALADLDLRSNRNPGEAVTAAKRLIELAPTAPHYYVLAVASAKNNDRTGAIEALKQAIALAPDEKRFPEMLQQLEKAR